MTVEVLNLNGDMVPHTVVHILGDGACLFRSLSFIIHHTQLQALAIRELIVMHVVNNWEYFSIMSHNRDGHNYINSANYFVDMSRPFTYGGLCELMAAGQLFEFVFEVYRNGELYVRVGDEGNPVRRLRFTQDLSSGHFDVYLTNNESEEVSNSPSLPELESAKHISQTSTPLPIPKQTSRKRRARYTDKQRKKQMKEARSKYEQNHPGREIEKRALPWRVKRQSAMSYDPNIDYEGDSTVSLGTMAFKCQHCNALKWKEEAPSMCCSAGKVQLPPFKPLPEPLYSLVMGSHPEHIHFMDRVRKYNSCFNMTSFGAKQIKNDGFNPTFKVQGQVYHLAGSLLPTPQQEAQFLQVYFMGDDARETQLRCGNFPGVKQNLVSELQTMLHDVNNYIKDLKTTLDKVPSHLKNFEVVIHADRKPANTHAGRFNAPSTKEVALVIVGQQFMKRDIVLQSYDNKLQRISEIHRSYDALQYPLLFCFGEDGYSIDIAQRDPVTKLETKKTISAASFYSYRFMIRDGSVNHILFFRSLLSQFLVDMYAKIETERLNYIRNNQEQLRADSYIHLRDAVGTIDANADQLGQKVVLPSSFTGGPRYMYERTQDAMTYVRHYGHPDLFITFTCNPKWKDITNLTLPGQRPHDRHDIIARVFNLKVKKIIALLNKGSLFGDVRCFMYTVEWQKRGLPHIHILLWLEQRIPPDMIDKVIYAEIPNPEQDPLLYNIIKTNMIHGPCGSVNNNSPCMKGGSCSKRFPRPLLKETQTGTDGYPQYRRRSPDEGGFTVKINGIDLDNRWVVPYNPVLSRTFNAHINVELCNSVKSIKYICKYVNKGSDQAAFALENENDEVKLYESGRYISSSEAAWRIFSFPIHNRYPTVFHLAVHLENGQRVYFTSKNLTEKLGNPPQTTLLKFFDLCKTDDFAKTLLYCEIPQFFVWKSNKFMRRKQGKCVDGWPGVKKDHALGRVYTIHPNNSECYYLRLLLHVVRGPTSFSSIKTVNGVVHPTFQSACKALGLLEDDKHWDTTLEEAALSNSPCKLRELFTVMLVFCQLSDAVSLWEKYKSSLSEDIARQVERELQDNLCNDVMDRVYNRCLLIIEDAVLALGGDGLLRYGLPQPTRYGEVLKNLEYLRETSYDKDSLVQVVLKNEEYLTNDQLTVYRRVLTSIESDGGQVFFLDAPGGTGKTFVINLLLAKVRSEGGIALAVASSGIAATLLEGGKTAHAAFKLPLNIIHSETSLCNISKQSNTAQVLRDCKLIVWDESTMAHKKAFEAVSMALQDIRGIDRVMGGVTVLLAGDFRQTLPVVPRGTRADEIKACVKTSYLWPNICKLYLKKNMRVHLRNDLSTGTFSELLLNIGDGNYPEADGKVTIPSGLGTVVSTVEQLTSTIYPDIANIKEKSCDWLCERAILTPKNENANIINNILLGSFESAGMEYNSIDSVLKSDEVVCYPVEFLNTLNPPGFPAHKLLLKVGAPVMLLRNLNPPKLCNGTRLQVKALHQNVIEASVFTGCARGESVFIPRIPLIPSDYPFEFKRLQFPLKVCFAITINKSQGQSLKIAGLDLREECFTHGQFYVACSRVSSPSSLVMLAPTGTTRNVVYKEVL